MEFCRSPVSQWRYHKQLNPKKSACNHFRESEIGRQSRMAREEREKNRPTGTSEFTLSAGSQEQYPKVEGSGCGLLVALIGAIVYCLVA